MSAILRTSTLGYGWYSGHPSMESHTAILLAQQSISWRIELGTQFEYWGQKSHTDRLDKFSTVSELDTVGENRTVKRDVFLLQYERRNGYLPPQHTSAHGGHFWPSSLVAMGAYQTVPGREFVIPLMLRTKRRAPWTAFNCLQIEDSWGWDYEGTWNYLLQSARRHGNLTSVTSVTQPVSISFQGDFKLKPPLEFKR